MYQCWATVKEACWASMYLIPLSSHVCPDWRSSVQWKRSAMSVNRHGAQHALEAWSTFTFDRLLWLGFEPHSICLTQCCCYRRWTCLPSWWVYQGSARCHPPLRCSPHCPWPSSLRPLCGYNVPSHSMSWCAHRLSECSHCRMWSGLLTWNFNSWQSTVCLYPLVRLPQTYFCMPICEATCCFAF